MASWEKLAEAAGKVVGGEVWPRDAVPDVSSWKVPSVVYRLAGGATAVARGVETDSRHDYTVRLVADSWAELWRLDALLALALREAGMSVGPPADEAPDDQAAARGLLIRVRPVRVTL